MFSGHRRDRDLHEAKIARFAQQYEIQYAQMAATSVLSTIPAVLLMFLGQRFLISGLTLGAVTYRPEMPVAGRPRPPATNG